MSTGRPFLAMLALLLLGAAACAQTLDYRLKARQVAKDTWVIEGANEDFAPGNGCNIINTGFIVTSAGTLVINTGPSRLYGEQQRRVIQGVSPQPVVAVFNLNLHPDYFFGNQAWSDTPTYALPGTRRGMQAEGNAYADNLYKLCGDWMRGTESTPSVQSAETGSRAWGDHDIALLRFQGHTADDLVLVDRTTGVVFAGGLVFSNRAPTTPHAQLDQWLSSINQLEQAIAALPKPTVVVPSHGPVDRGLAGFSDTRNYLQWMDRQLQSAALRGVDLAEALHLPIAPEFRGYAAVDSEFQRSVVHLYPDYEKKALTGELRH